MKKVIAGKSRQGRTPLPVCCRLRDLGCGPDGKPLQWKTALVRFLLIGAKY